VTEGSDMSDDGLRLDNLLSSGIGHQNIYFCNIKFSQVRIARAGLLVKIHLQNTRLMIQYPALLRGIVN
jgi:hypothetical protein